MATSIPASAIVQVNPGVISAGGTALSMSGLMITNSSRAPIGQVLTFSSAASVGTYFGLSSTEYSQAAVYFKGADKSYIKPGNLLIAQYNANSVSAYLRGGTLSLTLTQLQAITTGTFTVTIDGVAKTSGTINLSTATSFSNAATLIQTALNASPATVTWDSIASAFVITSGTTGATSSITVATGTLSATLGLTVATGAVLSQGAAATTPATFMSSVVAINDNFATFWTVFDPDNGSGNTVKQAFAAWNSTQNNAFMYICWDPDQTPTTTVPATTSLGYLLSSNSSAGTCLIYAPTAGDIYYHSAFVAGYVAGTDWTATQGTFNLKFAYQSGISASVTSQTIAANLEANSYNYYGLWAEGNSSWSFMSPGSVSGSFKWAQDYVNQIWLNSSLQIALMNLLYSVKSVPYNRAGYALIEAACSDPIRAAVNFGAIQAGVTLNAIQIAELNYAANGLNIAPTVQQQGWYLLVQDASATTRAARQSPPITFWYTSGGSVNVIQLASLEVQ